MKRASYRHAVRWIAENDEPTIIDLDSIASQITTQLVADIFGKDPFVVAIDIARERMKCTNSEV